ncbi:hypothetical protein Y1Q_0023232 [Alligator mississippiensis]|uniref:Uncharacterized protein n=1 Tax=Alligator mississippiensis TaxID=8496 RepID=A0A151MJH6_ALLMI|nr:hypothetical protein Y1Q_0023232 [Alligator mississippiensis]
MQQHSSPRCRKFLSRLSEEGAGSKGCGDSAQVTGICLLSRLFKNSLLPDEVWQGINMDQESGISRHLVQLIETEQTIFAAHPGIFQIHGSREKQILS